MKLINEIKEELSSVLKGKTLDVLLPPLVFVVANQFLSLGMATVVSLIFSMLLLIWRLEGSAPLLYAIFGFVGVAIAALFAYLMDSVGDYFLPGIIGSVLLAIVTALSMLIKRPLPILMSHVTRGWTFQWFLRKDIFPAYFEVGILWFAYFTIRAAFQVVFYLADNVQGLTLMSTIFGFPLTIGVLILSYVYGIYRLRKLKGPGIDEYDAGKTPPYEGQKRGF